MNNRILIVLICLIAAPSVYASHINAFSTSSIYDLHSMANVTDSTGTWTHSAGNPGSYSEVSDTVMNMGNEFIVFNTYVFGTSNNATLTLGFGSDTVGNLAGDDLAIFTLDPLTSGLTVSAPTILDVSIGETTMRYTSAPIFINSLLQGVYDADNNLLGANSAILIDLDDFGLGDGAILQDPFVIDVLTATENPLHFPTITAAGAFNTTVVPLPLPIVLFGSGLALLGFVGRRNKIRI